jgi:hypothetical protein
MMTVGSLPSITATQELVVPRSIPMIFPIIFIFFKFIIQFLSVACSLFRFDRESEIDGHNCCDHLHDAGIISKLVPMEFKRKYMSICQFFRDNLPRVMTYLLFLQCHWHRLQDDNHGQIKSGDVVKQGQKLYGCHPE